MQLIDQSVDQQIVPEQATQDHKDIFAAFVFERGDLLVRICSFDDTGILPWVEFRLRKPRPVLAGADPARQKKHKKNSEN